MIEFQKPYGLDHSEKYIMDCLRRGSVSGDGKYTKMCEEWLQNRLNTSRVLMTTSCTHALELALHMLDLSKEDQVILPSYTYPSTANAVLMAGGKVVFSQVTKGQMTLDPERLEEKITENTKAIMPVHYGGNVCDMDPIMALAKKYGLVVIEDVAQGLLSTYKGREAGTFGDFGCFSFHGTKDVVAGEGGALAINNLKYLDRATIFRHKGTNREAFVKGRIARYEWVAKGSSYGPSDLLMALLYGQLEQSDKMAEIRRSIYSTYVDWFTDKAYKKLEGFSQVGQKVQVNGHMFWLRFKTPLEGDRYCRFMKENGVSAYSHFVPLHDSMYGRRFMKVGDDFSWENDMGRKLIRLPLYPDLTTEAIDKVLMLTDQYMVSR